MSLTYGELFAGYDGLGLGVRSILGGESLWFAEFDKAPSAILAHHYPDVPNLGDVTKVDWHAVPKVDVITGGSPCQDLSHAGKRKGMTDGTRSNLWAEMREAVAVIRPRLVVWENVRGALSAPADSDLEPCPGCVGDLDDGPVLRALGRVLGDLAELGYDARWYGLRAADVGAAHGRFRIFLFATPADSRSVRWGEGASDWAGPGTAPREGQTGGTGGHPLLGADGEGLTLLPTPAVNDMGEGKTVEHWDAWTARMQAAHGNGNGHGKSLAIEAQRLLLTPRTSGTKGGPNQRGSSGDLMLPSAVCRLLPTPATSNSKSKRAMTASTDNGRRSGGGQSSPLGLDEVASLASGVIPSHLPEYANLPPESKAIVDGFEHATQDWGEYEAAILRHEHALGRPSPSPTEPGAKGQPRLSPRFVEWLMMLPAGWVTDVPGISRNDMLKALGNGVVPPQAAAATQAFLFDISKEARSA